MSERPSQCVRNDECGSSSPKRKKARQKYAPKACVSCRRSKLKCSGDNPCQRCRDSGKRCFFSEDQTAAEALQNLSRPSLSQQPSTSNSTSTSNASNLARRNLVPSHENAEQRLTDANALGLSMEARMARIESMMDALLQERTMFTSPHRSVERDESCNDMGMSLSIPMPMPHLMHPPTSLSSQASPPVPHSQDAIDPSLDTEMSSLRVGSQTLAFPVQHLYEKYVDCFFRQLQMFHPCVDEELFWTRSARMLSAPEVLPNDVCFLGLNYMIFAMYIAVIGGTRSYESKPAGWHWLQLADDVVGQRQFYGQGDVSLAQYLVLKAVYYMLVDQPGLAYNTIGLASRYALQQGLNRQSTLLKLSMQEDMQDAQHQSEKHTSTDAFLGYMVYWSRFAGSLWDSLLTAHVSPEVLAERVNTFQAAVIDFFDNTFVNSSLESSSPHLHQYVEISFDNLQLVAQRATATTRQFGAAAAQLSARLATQTLAHVQRFETDTNAVVVNVLQYHTTPSLTISLLLLCSLLVSDLGHLGLPLDTWIPYVQQSFDAIINLLSDRSQDSILARRVLRDFGRIIPVILAILSKWATETLLLQSIPDWSLVQDVIPPNVAELLPYREQPPNIGDMPTLYRDAWMTHGGHMDSDGGVQTPRSSVLWV
ncbi:hypothetical protein E8E13_006361 [Curvularia kusanoi]|uniref:Zn(2)-C6 fungal-type domain-containing protein n=1 Tax=Curvularia kusanoi TaxID=90978 RepID=A0A9P4T9D4_CURKU|nr:hypothetical protein E8E13_006361 [Curvularia kusanoi]